jgi:cytochrome c peroxidase
VGIGEGRDKDREFDTPTLVEIWRTATYLYDGRAVTIEEVLTKYNPGDKHGTTSNLTKGEISDLTEFVLSQ